MFKTIQNKIIGISIFAFFIIFITKEQYPQISLYGCVISLIITTFIFIFKKIQFHYFNFVSYHSLAISLPIIYPMKTTLFAAILIILLREVFILSKDRGEANSRTSLLWDLSLIKPKRSIFKSLKYTFYFTILAIFAVFLINNFAFVSIPLAYFPLFIFAMCLGSLLCEEFSPMTSQNR